MKIEQGTSNRLYTFNEYELAQHDLEVRKPLEDEIVSLKRYISQLEYWKSYWYNSYDEIRNKYNKQERQKVIAELEEWYDINEQFGVHNEKYIKDLQ